MQHTIITTDTTGIHINTIFSTYIIIIHLHLLLYRQQPLRVPRYGFGTRTGTR
jgi:hypothetical protein